MKLLLRSVEWTPGAHRRMSSLLTASTSPLTPSQSRRARSLHTVPDYPLRYHPHRYSAAPRSKGEGHHRPSRFSQQSPCRGNFLSRWLSCNLLIRLKLDDPAFRLSSLPDWQLTIPKGVDWTVFEGLGTTSHHPLPISMADTLLPRPSPAPKIHSRRPTSPCSPQPTAHHSKITAF